MPVPNNLQAQGAGDLQFAGLGRAIGAAAFVGDVAGDGTNVDVILAPASRGINGNAARVIRRMPRTLD